MKSRILFGQLLTPTPIVTFFSNKAYILSSQNHWPPSAWRHLWTLNKKGWEPLIKINIRERIGMRMSAGKNDSYISQHFFIFVCGLIGFRRKLNPAESCDITTTEKHESRCHTIRWINIISEKYPKKNIRRVGGWTERLFCFTSPKVTWDEVTLEIKSLFLIKLFFCAKTSSS